MNAVIIGAGPIGLYLACVLEKMHINVRVYDPRAGQYTRPGHINQQELQTIKIALGQDPQVSGYIHIKDIERTLYNYLQDKNILVEPKLFVGFNSPKQAKGVIVFNQSCQEELIECDYVFDCTGSKRELVNGLNAQINPPPFSIKPIVNNICVKNHLIAYVRMSYENYQQLLAQKGNDTKILPNYPAELYVQLMEQLRDLGWQEFGLPMLRCAYVGKEKVCCYVEAPDHLATNQYQLWLQAVINITTQTQNTISFSELSPSQKYGRKPRFSLFPVMPHEVKEAIYENASLPIVIPIGDSKIDPHYILGHGLKDGVECVDTLGEQITTNNGQITEIDIEQYIRKTSPIIKSHKIGIHQFYETRDFYFLGWLKEAKKNYLEVIKNLNEQTQLVKHYEKILDEIEERLLPLKKQKNVGQTPASSPESLPGSSMEQGSTATSLNSMGLFERKNQKIAHDQADNTEHDEKNPAENRDSKSQVR